MATISPSENPVDEEYDKFHVKCGRNVVFTNGRRTACGKDVSGCGIVFSAKPILEEVRFQVKILDSPSHVYLTPLVSISLKSCNSI